MSYINLLSIGSQGGWTIALVGYGIVFTALIALVIVFVNLPKLLQINLRSKLKKQGKSSSNNENDYTLAFGLYALRNFVLKLLTFPYK